MTSDLPARAVLRPDALVEGWSDPEIARLLRSGAWTRLRRGAYLTGAAPAEAAERHRLLVHATLATLRRPAVVSHQSAAVLLGLPLWDVPLDKVHITRRPPGYSGSSAVLRSHIARLREDEVIPMGSYAVTSRVRTALDLARSLPFGTAVVALDAALQAGALSQKVLRQRVFDLSATRGGRAAARAVAFADGRSESVGESRSRVLLHALGLMPTALQHEIRTPDGALVGRTDFAWEAERVVGEFDGRIKYGRLLKPGQEPGDAVFEEKRREDAIRDEGWGVVRWTWRDLAAPHLVGARVRRALDRGRASR
jgi:hypothetical protein